MKKSLFFALAFVCSSLFLTSCGDDGPCKTCELSVFGIGSTEEICEDGDDLTITTTALGFTDTRTVSDTTLSVYVSGLESAGYSCN